MNDKLLNIAMIVFFASILINGLLIMVSLTPEGSFITGWTNDSSNGLGYSDLKEYSINTPDGFISNTAQSQDSSSFNPFEIIDRLGKTVFAGVNAVNLLIMGFFLLEMVFFNMSLWFPIFSPIFLAVAGLVIGSKLLLIGYAGSVLLNAIMGRR